MSYELHVDAGATGGPSLERLATTTDKLSAGTQKLNDALYGQSKASETLTIAQAKLAIEETKLEQLRERHRIQIDGLSAASIKSAAALDAVSAGNQRVVSSSMAATSALRVMEGSFPLRSAGAFLSTIQGLAPALSAAFPVIGAVALVGVFEQIVDHVDKWYDKYVLLSEVQKEIARTAKDLASSTEQSYFNVGRMQIEELRHRGLYAQAGAMQQAQTASTPVAIPEFDQKVLQQLEPGEVRRIKQLYQPTVAGDLSSRIQDAQIMQRELRTAGLNVGQPGFQSWGNEQQIAKTKEAVDNLVQYLTQRQQEFAAEMKAIGDRTIEEAGREAKEAHERSVRSLNELRRGAQSPTATLLEKFAALQPSERAAGAEFMRGRLPAVAQKEFLTYAEKEIRGGLGTGYEDAFSPDGRTPHKLTLTGFDDSEDAQERYRNQKQAISVYEAAELGRVNTQAGTIREQASRRGRLAAARANPGDELGALREQLAIRKEGADQELALKVAHSGILDIDRARLAYVKEIGDLDLEYQTKILTMKKQQKEEMVSMAVGLVMAAQHGGVAGYLKGQLEGIEAKVLGNVARAAIESPTGKSITDKLHAGAGTTMGKLLEGTPFGPDPAKAATDLNTAATELNTAALNALRLGGAGGGSAGGGGGIAGLSKFIIKDNYGAPSAGGGGAVDYEGTAVDPDTGDPIGAVGGGGGSSAGSTMSAAGKGIAYGAGAATAGWAAYSGFKKGGAQGALQGTSAILGAASMIPGPQQPFVAAAAMLTAITGSILGDSHAKRQAEIGNTLKTSQFMAPVSINASMTSSGSYADYDRFGNVRGSSLSPFPSVEQGFFDYRRDVTVAGRTNSYFGGQGGSGSAPAPAPTVIIQAWDGADVERVLTRHSGAVAGAVDHALVNNRATGLQETMRSM